MTEKQYGMLMDLNNEFPSVYPVELIEKYMIDEFPDDNELESVCIEVGDSSRFINGRWFIF